jgi:two-component system, NarL family, sensor histidine kinase DegS
MVTQQQDVTNIIDEFIRQNQMELDQAKRSLKEVSLMFDQSQVEMSKLTQRSTTVNAHLNQVQNQIETMPRADIRQAYTAALDVQQRLVVMRGQLEKLQSDQTHLQKIVSLLESSLKFVSENKGMMAGKPGKSGTAMVEMVINAQEAERQRLSRQMHDGPAQALSNFIVQTEIAARLLESDQSRAKEELNSLKTAAMTTFQKVRVFIFELRPMMLDDLGLFPTIRRYVDSFREQTGLDVSLTIKGQERRLEPYLEVMIFRSLQELLGNAARHNLDSAIKIQISVQIFIEADIVRVSVSDNGKGFDPETLADKGGIGLNLIRERVEMLGGQIEIDAAVSQGCKVTFQIPCADFG